MNVNVTDGRLAGKGVGRYKAKRRLVIREGDTLLFKLVKTIPKGAEFEVTLVSDRGWGYIPEHDAWADLGGAEMA